MSDQPTSQLTEKPRIAVSACLVGEPVRYDGDHKRHPQVVGLLASLFELIPVCPEVEIGLGIPREPIQLEQTVAGVRLVAVQSRQDYTLRMQEFAHHTAAQIESWQACGYLLKSRSPSCGLHDVKLFDKGGSFQRSGRGIFAQQLQQDVQSLPLAEETALEDAATREHFIEQVQAFHQLRSCLAVSWSPAGMCQFHATHRRQLESHDQKGAQQLAQLVDRIGVIEPKDFQAEYRQRFLAILAQPVART